MNNSLFTEILDLYNENSDEIDRIKKIELPFTYKSDVNYFYYELNGISNYENLISLNIAKFCDELREYARKANSIGKKSVKELKLDNVVDQITLIGKALGYNFKKQIIRDVFSMRREPTSPEEELIRNIGETFYSVTNDNLNIRTLNQKITGYVGFRNFNIDRDGSLATSYKFIPERYEQIMKFSLDNKNSIYLTASQALYFTRSDHFFRRNNELTSILFLEKLLSKHVPKITIDFFPIIKVFNRYNSYIKKAINSTRENGDFTHAYLITLAIISECVRESIDQITSLTEQITSNHKQYDTKEKNYFIKKITTSNPKISKRQATFYLEHRDKNSYYTIEDFKNFTNSSYETSRYSLENLVKEGIYTKIKLGKKFVYKPTK